VTSFASPKEVTKKRGPPLLGPSDYPALLRCSVTQKGSELQNTTFPSSVDCDLCVAGKHSRCRISGAHVWTQWVCASARHWRVSQGSRRPTHRSGAFGYFDPQGLNAGTKVPCPWVREPTNRPGLFPRKVKLKLRPVILPIPRLH